MYTSLPIVRTCAVFALLCAISLVPGLQARMMKRDELLKFGTISSSNSSSSGGQKKSYKFCADPVQKEKVEFPESLIGRAKVNFDMYSGYVQISDAPDYLFYWFFSTQDGNKDAPLIIWTNGGPGCSAMEGATTETGPLSLFDIKESCTPTTRRSSSSSGGENCDYSEQLSTNPYAWNAHANLLYLDQPKNVGYSFGYGEETRSSTEAAAQFIVFYQNWLSLFPDFIGRPLIIAGESYGGHYVPAWADAILDFNEQLAAPQQQHEQQQQQQQQQQEQQQRINFAGVAIGNGCVNDTVQDTAAFIDFQHASNLIPADANPRSYAAAEAAMVDFIGYQPNYYDYRIESISCPACYGYNYTAWSYWFLKEEVLESLHICGEAGEDAFSGAAGGCISMGAFDATDASFSYSAALARTLEAGVPVVLYFGKTDTACNYIGGSRMADTIEWTGQQQFLQQPLLPLEVFGVEAGQMKSFGGLTFLQIDSSGHMTPMDQPAASASVIYSLLQQQQKQQQ